MLTPEREAEIIFLIEDKKAFIKKLNKNEGSDKLWHGPELQAVIELLAELDRLRAELKPLWECYGPAGMKAVSGFIEERDALKAENEKLKNFLSPAGQEEFLLLEQRDNLRKVNQSLRERIEKLRKALKSIAAPHLEPFCPELFDSMWEEVYNDTMLAREALAQDDERCKHDVHGEDCFTCYPEEKKG